MRGGSPPLLASQQEIIPTKKLDRLYIRVDANFPSDEKYQALPYKIRDSAYLFFEALNGWSRDKKTDGRVPVAMARAKGGEMGHPPGKVGAFIDALVGVGLLVPGGSDLLIPKYPKWQDTREEMEGNHEAKQRAGRAGGVASGRSRREAGASDSGSRGEAGAKQVPKQTKHQTETETETEPSEPYGSSGDLSPSSSVLAPSPRRSAADGLTTEEPAVRRYVERWMQHSARAPSSDDLEFARRIPYEFPRLSEPAVLEAITEVAGKFTGRGKPMPRLTYLAGRLADLNAAAADAGVVRRSSAAGGVTRLGDLLPGGAAQ